MNTDTVHTTMFRLAKECGDRDADLPGSRYFCVQSDESRLSSWVSEDEFRYLCELFNVTPPNKPAPPAIESLAYDTENKPLRGFSVRAYYLKAPKEQQALIEISKDGKVVRSFEYPAYRIWNVAAHFDEYIDGLDAEGNATPLSDEKETL